MKNAAKILVITMLLSGITAQAEILVQGGTLTDATSTEIYNLEDAAARAATVPVVGGAQTTVTDLSATQEASAKQLKAAEDKIGQSAPRASSAAKSLGKSTAPAKKLMK